MRKWLYLITLVLLLSYSGGFARAQSKEPWLHLEVQEKKADPTFVKVNLPIAMVDIALDMIKNEKLKNGWLKLDTKELSVAEMRQIWNGLRKAGDAEFVTVEKRDETVRVTRQGNFLLVKVTGPDKHKPKVDLKVPVSVVDALLEGRGEELNIKAALLAMPKKSAGDILIVNDENSQVRLWID